MTYLKDQRSKSALFAAFLCALTVSSSATAGLLYKGDYEAGFTALRLSGNGSIAQDVKFNGSGTYVFTIRAFGTSAGGVAPKLDIQIDGKTSASVNVTATGSPGTYNASVSIPVGVHKVGIAFANAASGRSVSIQGVSIAAASGSSSGVSASPSHLNGVTMPMVVGSGTAVTNTKFKDTESCCAHSIQLTDSVVRSGKQAGKFQLNRNDPMVFGGKRTEVLPPNSGSGLVGKPGTATKAGDERWYGFSIFIPADWVNDLRLEKEILFQVHEKPDACETWRSPPVALGISEGNWIMTKIWNGNACSVGEGYGGGIGKETKLGALDKGKWTDFVIHVKWSYQATTDAKNPVAGLLQVWKNGALIMNDVGPNYYNDQTEGYLKFGLYKWGWNNPSSSPSIVQSRVIYNDEFKVGDANSSFAEVSPGGTAPVPQPTTPAQSPVPAPKPTTTSPSTSAPLPPPESGNLPVGSSFTMKSVNSDKCLDLNGAVQTNDAHFMQTGCHGGNNQLFSLVLVEPGKYQIKVKHSGKCMAVLGYSKTDGAALVQKSCVAADSSQQFTMDHDPTTRTLSRIRPVFNGKCLQIAGASKNNNARLQQGTCAKTDNEKWVYSVNGTVDPAPKPTVTATPVPKPTATVTPKPTTTATPKPTASATPKPTATATPKPTATVVPGPAPITDSSTIAYYAFNAVADITRWYERSIASAWSATIVSSPTRRAGGSAVRFELRTTDTKHGNRSELGSNPSISTKESWYGFSTYFPSGEFVKDPVPEIIMQLHSRPDLNEGEAWRSPPVALGVKDDRLMVELRHDANRITKEVGPNFSRVDIGAIEKNKWIDWVIHARWAYDKTGILEIWKDGKLVLSRINQPNSYNDATYPYMKIGIYKWDWAHKVTPGVTKRVIYYDEVTQGNGSSNYSKVFPGR